MLFPVRLMPTTMVASLVVAPGFTATIAPKAPAPLLAPSAPAPAAGEPGSRESQSRMIWAEAQLVKLVVSARVGTCLKSGLAVELFVPGPNQESGMRLLLKVMALASGVALVTLRVKRSMS